MHTFNPRAHAFNPWQAQVNLCIQGLCGLQSEFKDSQVYPENPFLEKNKEINKYFYHFLLLYVKENISNNYKTLKMLCSAGPNTQPPYFINNKQIHSMEVPTSIYDKITSTPRNCSKIDFFRLINKSLPHILILLPVYLGLHESFFGKS